MKTKLLTLTIIVLAFTAGAGLGFLLFLYIDSRDKTQDEAQNYPLLSERIFVENPSQIKINFFDLRQELITYLDDMGEDGKRVSIYFEYLPSGVSININETNNTIAASLFKVPYVMQLYKAVEQGKININKRVEITEQFTEGRHFGNLDKKIGEKISLEDAVYHTLVESDNTSINIIGDELKKNFDLNDLKNYIDLDVFFDRDSNVARLSARSYGYILKCLYLSCYNKVDDSQHILQLLTETKFNDRLTKYLPADLNVSHKIGTFNNQFQSDCGIVYLHQGDANYIICVMVEGSDPEASEEIAQVSKIIYTYMDRETSTSNYVE